MPKSKAVLMKKTRQRRKDSGLVEFRAWVTPEERDAIKLALSDIRNRQFKKLRFDASKVYAEIIKTLKDWEK